MTDGRVATGRATGKPLRRAKGRPADADSAATRQSIVDAALWAFGNHGYEGTSMQIIAGRAGLTPATLYHYFPSKAEIFRTVGDEVTAEFRNRCDGAVACAETARLRIAAILGALGDWIVERPEVASFISTYAAEVTRNNEVRRLSPPERWTEPVAYYASFIRDGIDRGEVRPDLDPEAVGAFVQGLIYGMSAVVAVGRPFGPPELVIDAFVRAIDGSLFTGPD